VCDSTTAATRLTAIPALQGRPSPWASSPSIRRTFRAGPPRTRCRVRFEGGARRARRAFAAGGLCQHGRPSRRADLERACAPCRVFLAFPRRKGERETRIRARADPNFRALRLLDWRVGRPADRHDARTDRLRLGPASSNEQLEGLRDPGETGCRRAAPAPARASTSLRQRDEAMAASTTWDTLGTITLYKGTFHEDGKPVFSRPISSARPNRIPDDVLQPEPESGPPAWGSRSPSTAAKTWTVSFDLTYVAQSPPKGVEGLFPPKGQGKLQSRKSGRKIPLQGGISDRDNRRCSPLVAEKETPGPGRG